MKKKNHSGTYVSFSRIERVATLVILATCMALAQLPRFSPVLALSAGISLVFSTRVSQILKIVTNR